MLVRMVRVASYLAISGTMNDGKHHDLLRRLVDHIDNDVWRLDEFARSFDQAKPADMREARNREPVNAGSNALDQFGHGTRVAAGNPIEDVVKIVGSGLADHNLLRQGDGAAAR